MLGHIFGIAAIILGAASIGISSPVAAVVVATYGAWMGAFSYGCSVHHRC